VGAEVPQQGGVLTGPSPYRWSGAKREPLWVIARLALHAWAGVWFRKDVAGFERIPSEGPAILIFNHVAYLDALAALYVADRARRRARFLAKRELFDDPRLSWLLRGTKMIPVARGTAAAGAALDQALVALRSGEIVALFPEGSAAVATRHIVRPLKSGAARLALDSGVQVIPCALWGTQNVWPKQARKNWRPGHLIAGRVGEPLWPSGDAHSVEDVRRVSEELRGALQRMVDEVVGLVAVRPEVA
jgi:1-acyl-sn-glycerol-3-phosphate acyltransferase